MLKLFRFLKPKFWLIIIIFLMIGAQSFSQLMLPSLMGEIVANITGPTGADNSFILRKGLEMIAYAGATIIIAFATSIGISYVGAYFGKKLRAEVFKKVLSFSPGDYDRIGTASLMTRTTNDVEMVQTVVVMGLRIMVMSPIIMAIAIVQVLRTDVQLAIILAFSIPLIIITIIILFAIAMPLFKKLQIAIDEVTKVLRASLTGVRVVRAFNQEEKEKERFAKVNRHQTNLIIKVGRTMSFASPIISIFFDLTYFAIFLFGFAIIDGTANDARLDNILVTSQYAMHIMMSFLMFSMLLISIPRAGVSARRINEV
ncbi:MAG TPA: ABC transporter permease, partial [Bacilli bacterium]|nr:ABC transporter permease [Bacilli bacterium]